MSCRKWTAVFIFLALTALLPDRSVLSATIPLHRYALLVGISNYHAYNQTKLFPDIDCENDVSAIEQALVARYGFKVGTEEIVTLTSGEGAASHPEQTTRKAILSALDQLCGEARPGDLVYIHFSCHGDQVLDPTEPGGLDSTIVPSDYRDDFPPESKTDLNSNEISGKTILSYIHKIQSAMTVGGAVKGQLVISFDSCHSASAARGLAAVKRGSSFAEYVSWYSARHSGYHGIVDPSVEYAQPTSQAETPSSSDMPLQRSADTGEAWSGLSGAGYVVISACQNNACAYETTTEPVMGRLSYCLAKALAQATPDTTYQQLFDQLNAMFHASYDDQFPQIDGDPNTTLFGGAATPPPASIPALYNSVGDLTLSAGTLQDMSDGSTFALYRKDTAQTPQNEVAEAAIEGPIGLTSATLKITKKIGTWSKTTEYGAVETQHVYLTPPLSLDRASIAAADPADASAIVDAVRGVVSLDKEPADLKLALLPSADRSAGPGDLALVESGSCLALKIFDPAQGDLPDQIKTALDNEAKYRYACHLGEDQAGRVSAENVKLQIVPVVIAQNDDGSKRIVSEGTPLTTAQSLHLNEKFVIQVQNNSGIPLHLTLLDITGAHRVHVIWSASPDREDDNLLATTPPGKWATLWELGQSTNTPYIFSLSKTVTDEMVKAIATEQYADFGTLATRGPATPMEALVAPAVRTRDISDAAPDPGVSLEPQSWAVGTVSFKAL